MEHISIIGQITEWSWLKALVSIIITLDFFIKQYRNRNQIFSFIKTYWGKLCNFVAMLWRIKGCAPTLCVLSGASLVLLVQIIWYNTNSISAAHLSKEYSNSNKFTILVTDFDETIRNSLIEKLNTIQRGYKDTLVINPVKEVVKVDEKTEDIKKKYQDKGDFLIWAWYTKDQNFSTLGHHFEPVSQTKVISEEGLFRERTFPLSSSTEFAKEKTYFINEMVYLSLFTLGMNYYENEEWEKVILSLKDASNQALRPEPELDKRVIQCYQGIAYYMQSDYKSARDILEKASLDGKGGNFHKDCPNEADRAFNYSDEEMNRKTSGSGGGGGGGGGSLLSR